MRWRPSTLRWVRHEPTPHFRFGCLAMSVRGLPELGPVQGSSASAETWRQGWAEYLHYRGDPVAVMSQAGAADDSFVMGPVFAALYRTLAGAPNSSRLLVADAKRARSRVASSPRRERAHVQALERLLAGEFTAAANAWDEIAATDGDFAALRFAHDIYLHVGDAERRLASSSKAVEAWRGEPGWGFVASQHAFSLEEVGRYDEAEELGRAALSLDPDDLWARHALAHVYESTDDTAAALELLQGSVERWSAQDLLATHIWWHLAVRLLASGDAPAALEIFDERAPHATTAFTLCDQASLLWRLELAGCRAGDRWEALADGWDAVEERHTCAFLDMHAALVFARVSDHRGANRWFDALAARPSHRSENDATFDQVVKPLAEALRSHFSGDTASLVRTVDGLGASLSRIGGSIVQRDLVTLTPRATEVSA